ncbi:glycosyltransferase family 4 protein [Variovorax sp. efr-133-TYG-130]|uniref:glycosyltransferase family 4 protein n=1 Tax=Variovorax sp. efr-133-TYG-130 TaxID=3040327 RepID=UPI0025543166|nr:glycosyltransferase family 4 protein [Variovorax sp. efr-133-TYG-130]
MLGGYEIACEAVARALRQRGHDVVVLAARAPFATPQDPDWLKRVFVLRAYGPVEPHTAELIEGKAYEMGSSIYANSATLLDFLKSFEPDVVYAWHIWGIGGMALLDLLQQVDAPWLMHLMDTIPTYLLGGVKPVASSLFARHEVSLLDDAHTIAMSEHVLAEIRETTGVQFKKKPKVIPGWVDMSLVRRRTNYMEGGQLRMVAAGSLGAHKGIGIIVLACALLVKAGHTNFRVDIYGFGAAEPWLLLAAQHNISEYLNFLGARTQKEIMALLPEYDVFLFPTHSREPFGFAPIEAAACGVVPIVTRDAGCNERLVDAVHALKIDRTPESLAKAIEQFLENPGNLECIGQRAARMVTSDLSFEHCMDSIECALSDICRPWNRQALHQARLPSALFAKHMLGEHFTARP